MDKFKMKRAQRSPEGNMTRTVIALIVFTIVLSGIAIIAQQNPGDDDRRSAITLLRAINTAEAAVNRSGHYVGLPELIEHGSMARVKPDVVISGSTITYHGAQVRLAL